MMIYLCVCEYYPRHQHLASYIPLPCIPIPTPAPYPHYHTSSTPIQKNSKSFQRGPAARRSLHIYKIIYYIYKRERSPVYIHAQRKME